MLTSRYPSYLPHVLGTFVAIGVLSLAPQLHAAPGDLTPGDLTPGNASTTPAAPAAPASTLTTYSAAEILGLKPSLDSLNLKVYGWIENSYTYNTHSPIDHNNQARVFDTKDGYRLNQLAFNIERPVSADPKAFDLGGKIEAMYGQDAALIHSQYLFGNTDTTWQNSTGNLLDNKQFDPTVFYLQANLPVGNGLLVTVGKWATPLGFEVIDAPSNALFSRGLLFGYAIPFTHTGIKFDYSFNDNFSMYYALAFGWDTFGDNNGNLSNLLGATWKITDKLTWINNFIIGPEQTKDSNNYRTVYDTILTLQVCDPLAVSLNVDWGNESGPNLNGGAGEAAGNNWYGVAGYITYTFNEQLSTTLRAEYFRDETGSRLGTFPVAPDLVSLTYGFTIKPVKEFANLILRPEVRWDHSLGDALFDPNAVNGRKDQVTFSIDVIVTF